MRRANLIAIVRCAIWTVMIVTVAWFAYKVYAGRPTTPERLTLRGDGNIYERQHLARYRWAQERVRGLRVADIASGTCYGMEMLRKSAVSVAGYDREPICGNHVIDLEKQAWPEKYDVVVSFETAEHLANPEYFLANARSSAPVLLFSAPVGEAHGNEHHKQHWTGSELRGLLEREYGSCKYWHQAFDGDKIETGPTEAGYLIAQCP
jgi:hypothetical protein